MQDFVSVGRMGEVVVDGDVLLWRGRGLISRMIATAGRSEYSHAGMAAWWHDELMCLEVREFVGGRCVTLGSQVEKCSGRVDVYRLATQRRGDVSMTTAVSKMKGFAGCEYGYLHLMRAAAIHAPVMRFWANRKRGDNGTGPPFCSEAVDRAYLAAGLDLVPRLRGRLTEPADISRSAALEYVCTLRQ